MLDSSAASAVIFLFERSHNVPVAEALAAPAFAKLEALNRKPSAPLLGHRLNASEAPARAFLGALSDADPDVTEAAPPSDAKRDPATLIGIASLILALPGATLAALEIRDRLNRREIRRALAALKAELAEADGSARLTLPTGTSIDLARTSTDAAIDLVIKELGAR